MNIFKLFTPQMWLMFLPAILLSLGGYFKNKDVGTDGGDDAFGNVLIALAPAVEAIASSNENALKKALNVLYTTTGNYLGKTQ